MVVSNFLTRSTSIHSSYTSKLTDLSAVGRAVKIILEVRKFRCHNNNCTQTVFSEQHLPLTRKYSRLIYRTNHYLQKLLIEVSSRKCEYISGRKGKSYGTIIVNALDHRPVELLKSKDKEEVAEWIKRHYSILYVTRDRSSSYICKQ